MKWVQVLKAGLRFLLWVITRSIYLVYLFVFRSFLYALTLFCVVYFTVNSSVFLPILLPALDKELPGTIHVDSVQWGPLPWQTRIIGANITDPDGISVITADKVYAEVDLSDLFTWLIPELGYALFDARWLSGPTAFHIRITRAEVYDYWVLLDFMNGDEPSLARAFDDGLPSVGPSRGPAKVDIPYAFGTRGRCDLVFPGFRMTYSGIEFRDSAVHVKNGGVTVITPELDIAQGELLFDPESSPLPPKPWTIPIRNFNAKGFYLHHDYFEVGQAKSVVGQSSLTTFGSLFFRPNEPTSFQGETLLNLTADDPIVRSILGEWAYGSAQVWLGGDGPVLSPNVTAEIRSPSLKFRGLETTELFTTARLLHPEGGFAVAIDRLDLSAGSGRINVTQGFLQPYRHHLHLNVALAAVSPVAVLTSPLVGLGLNDVLFLDGALSGRLGLSLDYGPDELHISADIGTQPLVWDRGSAPLALPFDSTVELSGAITYRDGLLGTTLDLAPVEIRSGDSYAWTMATLDIARNGIDALLDLEIPDLGQRLTQLGISDISGQVFAHGARITGPMTAPDVNTVSLRGKSISTPWIQLDSLQTRASLTDGKLAVDKLTATSDLGSLGLSGSVQLFVPSTLVLDPDFAFSTTSVSATDFPLAKLLPTLGGRLDISHGTASGLLRQWTSIRATAQVVLTELAALPERIESAVGSAVFQKGHLLLTDTKLDLPAARSAHINTLDVDIVRGTFVGNIDVNTLVLEQSRLIQTANLPLSGTVSAKLTIQSGLGRASWEGLANVQNLRFGDVILGDTDITLTKTTTPGQMAVTASPFFHGMALLTPSFLQIGNDGLPERLFAEARFEKADVYGVLPFLKIDGLTTEITGKAHLDLDFRPAGAPPVIIVTTDPDGSKVTWKARGIDIVAKTPLKIAVLEQGRIDIAPVLLQSGDRKLAVCGTLFPDGALESAIQVSTPLDFWGLERDVFAMLEGKLLSINNPGQPNTDPKNTCFYQGLRHDPAPGTPPEVSAWPPLSSDQTWVLNTGAVRVFGTLKNPLLEGRLAIGPLASRPRGLGDEIRSVAQTPWILDLWTDTARNKTVQKLGSPADNPWKGTLGEGSFTLSTQAMLRAWELEEVDLRLDGVGIDYVSGENYRFKFTTDLVAKGRRLSDVGRRKVDLSGNINVLEGTYATGSRRAQDVFGRTSSQRKITNYSRSLLETLPWLGPVGLKLNVAGSNFLVRMALPVGETDVELRIDTAVKGTIADPELFGRIDTLPGGLLTNTVVRRELEIVKAVADFSGDAQRPMLDTEVRAEVTFQEERSQDSSLGLNQVWSSFSGGRAEERTVVIRITVRGPVNLDRPGREFADLEVDLTSDGGGYERSELLTLLLTGAPPGTGEDGQEYGAAVNVVTDELAGVLAQTLLGAFVDGVQVGVNLGGGVDWALQKSLGRGLKFEVRGSEESSRRLVQPRFEFRLSDRLSFEGSLRYQQGQDFAGQTYETKLRYRIPLD